MYVCTVAVSHLIRYVLVPVGMKQSISGHSSRHCDGRTPAGSGPPKEKAMDRQKGDAVKFLFPLGQGCYEVVWKGAESDTSTSKTSLRGWNSRGMTRSLGQNKKHTYTSLHTQRYRQTLHTTHIILVLYIAMVQNWHVSNAISFFPLPFTHIKSHPHTEKMPSGL